MAKQVSNNLPRTSLREVVVRAIKYIEEKWLGATNLNDIGFMYCALGDLDWHFAYVKRNRTTHSAIHTCNLPLTIRKRGDGPEA